MARRYTPQLSYTAIRIEGGLIPADELSRLTTLAEPSQTEQTETHYHVPKGLKVRDEIARYFKISINLWRDFQLLRQREDVNAHDVTVREFLVPLLRDVLGFADLERSPAIEMAGHSYRIGHSADRGRVPLIFAAHNQPVDAAAERFGELNSDSGKVRRRSPFMLAQEALNASDNALWAIVTNGLTLRILRDNPSLTRPAYVEVDLEALFTEELYPDFTAFWLLAHSSRFGAVGSEQTDCPWERWRAAGQEVGVTVRSNLRYQVAEALRTLGTGFLSHPANTALRGALQRTKGGAESITTQAFFEELLRLVYRLIFLATVEDRTDKATGQRLIFAPGTPPEIQQRYLAGYSLTWLRDRAARRSQHDRHADQWQALSITFASLARGETRLGLPALGGLFDTDQCPNLDGAQLENRWLLAAIFQLGWFRVDGGLTRVNYRDMGPEELGSVYESLLELVPDLQGLAQPTNARLAFVGDDDSDASTSGNTRKLTGSYYTPDSLVQELIKSALEPVMIDTVKAHSQRPVEALMELTICDPACGSGHFLLSAARRMADEVATLRAAAERDGGAPTPADYRHALRDVVGHCIFGVDKNPMAIQLAKTALWLEAYTPDLPLSFIDHHLQVGDALLGVLDPKVLENGIPEEAYAALSGDDKVEASRLKKQNKADLKNWKAIAAGDLFTKSGLDTQAVAVETLADNTQEGIEAKRTAWAHAQDTVRGSTLARLADTYVAAFLAPKLPNSGKAVPLSGYLWGLLSGQPVDKEIKSAADALCHAHSVFHWWLAFPQVAAKGGFDVMLGNPPWERIKLQEEEFFATRSPLVASAKNKAERARRIDWLREGVLLHNLNPDLEAAEGLSPPNTAEMSMYDAFIAARRGAEAASLFAHSSGRFPLTGVGDVNTYALFAEVFLQATSPSGRAGFIVPTGIATDDSTKLYFGAISDGRLVRLQDLRTGPGLFSEIGHQRYKFCLLTIGQSPHAEFTFFALSVEQLSDIRRHFTLTPAEFALINPNTRTCPVFRSERDAELTKKLYHASPVLIAESICDADGTVLKPEVNPWGISFMRMFDMSNDSGLFHDVPAEQGAPTRLPLYEAKMIHQFDHRWATYVDSNGPTREVETADLTEEQRADPGFMVRPRYWIAEREVLARIARVPSRVANAWLSLHAVSQRAAEEALADLLLALTSWVAGELFFRRAGEPDHADGWSQQLVLQHFTPTETQLKTQFSSLADALLKVGITTKKAVIEFPKWAAQNRNERLSDLELSDLTVSLKATDLTQSLLELLDTWMDARSPRWLMGWRDICRNTDYRTLIASVIPRAGVGDKFLLLRANFEATRQAALLGDLDSITCDYIARQKVGGTSFKYFTMKQLAVLPPERFTVADINFIVPRVLELTFTAQDLRAWAEDLGHSGPTFTWNPERRAHLRAELDAFYARLYGLTRDELRYILDPAEVMGPDYPSETFRVLKHNEIRAFGEYRTRRLVLEAWDCLPGN